MNTNDPTILKTVHSKELFQIEFIDRDGQAPASREKFIGFIMREPKAQSGVKFAFAEFNVNYRYSTEIDSMGNLAPIPSNRDINIHFIVPVYEFDDHLRTFLHKIRKGSKVTFTVTIGQDDFNLNRLGLEMHSLMGWIGSDAYQIFSWVGEPQNSPVQYPRYMKFSAVPPEALRNTSSNHECCASDGFADYSEN